MTDISHPTEDRAFRDQTWNVKWLFVGLGFLGLWHSVRFVDGAWVARWPVFLWELVTGLMPQVFLLLFPLLTRDKGQARRIRLPRLGRCLVELAIAFPIVIATVFALGGLEYLVGRLFPGKTLVPDAVTNMALSPPRFVFPILLFSFTFAPVAEEVFFRGFLFNAFRRRMPVVVAGVVQSLIFGFSHFFGTTHAVIAVGLGILLTLVYKWRGTLVSPILVHAGINLVSSLGVVVAMAQYADRPAIGIFGSLEDAECVVRQVLPDSAASASGIAVGDRIVAMDGRPIADFPALVARVAARQPNETIRLTFVRDGKTYDIDVTLKRRGWPG